MVNQYVSRWIVNITDLSEEVHKWGMEVKEKRFDLNLLPEEKEYPVK
jgi:hypothetical protein